MKKNFFKKLSFVLASAMVLTALAPASGAFAAKGPKLNASEKYLFVGEGKKREEYNFNINNKKSGWKYEWASLDEDVVEVNKKNGVAKAVGIGTTKVAVTITDKDGELVDELEAKVIVKDNIKEVKISNPVEGTLGIGELHDFNRSFVTYGGSTKKTTAITRWEVAEEGATIDDSGKFTATVAGEYTVIARSFQSKSKYNSWLKDAEKYAKYVLATDEVKVTVANAMEVKQLDLDTFKLTFAAPVTDVEKNIQVSSVIGNAKVNQAVKKVEMSADNKVATVDLYVPFTEEATYVVDFTGIESVQFVAATTKAEDVKDIAILTKTVELGKATTLEIALYNAEGVNIANSTLLSRVELETSNVATYLNGKDLTMFNVNDTTTIKATYHTYKYDNTTGEELDKLTTSAVITCVDKSKDVDGTLNAYTVIDKDNTPDFKDAKHSIAAGDADLKLFVELKGKKANGDDKYTNNKDEATGWKYTSSNTDVLLVDEDLGLVYPLKAGTAVVVVKYNDVVVGSATITVSAAREVGQLTLSTYSFALSNDDDVKDEKVVEIKVKDQLGADYNNYSVNVTKTSSNSATVYVTNDSTSVTFNGAPGGVSVAAETYTYKVTVKDNASNKEMAAYITVNVQKPSSDTDVYYYRLEADKTSYDMKLTSTDSSEDVKLALFGYATNGVRNERVNITSGAFTVTVKDSKNNPQTLTADATYGAKFSLVTVSGGSIVKAEKGTYTATVTNASGDAINATYFTVTDTQPVPVLTVKKLYTDKAADLDAVKDCFKIAIDGSEKTITNFAYTAKVTDSKGVVSMYVKELYYDETYTVNGVTGTLRLTIPVNATIHYNYHN